MKRAARFLSALLLLLWAVPARAETIFQDTYTEGSSVELSAHTPDLGTGWTQIINIGTADLLVDSVPDMLRASGSACGQNEGAFYTADATYSSADYIVQFTLSVGDTQDDFVVPGIRAQDANNGYFLEVNNDGGQLYKRVAGTNTPLGAAIAGVADGSVVRLVAVGDWLLVYDDGVLIRQVQDGSITAAGKGGIGMGAVITPTADCSAQIVDDFSVYVFGTGSLRLSSVGLVVATPDCSTGNFGLGHSWDEGCAYIGDYSELQNGAAVQATLERAASFDGTTTFFAVYYGTDYYQAQLLDCGVSQVQARILRNGTEVALGTCYSIVNPGGGGWDFVKLVTGNGAGQTLRMTWWSSPDHWDRSNSRLKETITYTDPSGFSGGITSINFNNTEGSNETLDFVVYKPNAIAVTGMGTGDYAALCDHNGVKIASAQESGGTATFPATGMDGINWTIGKLVVATADSCVTGVKAEVESDRFMPGQVFIYEAGKHVFQGPRLGAVTNTTAKVWVGSDAPRQFYVETQACGGDWSSPASHGPVTLFKPSVGQTLESYSSVVDLAGLPADLCVEYRTVLDGVTGVSYQFYTHQAPGTEGKVIVTAANCLAGWQIPFQAESVSAWMTAKRAELGASVVGSVALMLGDPMYENSPPMEKVACNSYSAGECENDYLRHYNDVWGGDPGLVAFAASHNVLLWGDDHAWVNDLMGDEGWVDANGKSDSTVSRIINANRLAIADDYYMNLMMATNPDVLRAGYFHWGYIIGRIGFLGLHEIRYATRRDATASYDTTTGSLTVDGVDDTLISATGLFASPTGVGDPIRIGNTWNRIASITDNDNAVVEFATGLSGSQNFRLHKGYGNSPTAPTSKTRLGDAQVVDELRWVQANAGSMDFLSVLSTKSMFFARNADTFLDPPGGVSGGYIEERDELLTQLDVYVNGLDIHSGDNHVTFLHHERSLLSFEFYEDGHTGWGPGGYTKTLYDDTGTDPANPRAFSSGWRDFGAYVYDTANPTLCQHGYILNGVCVQPDVLALSNRRSLLIDHRIGHNYNDGGFYNWGPQGTHEVSFLDSGRSVVAMERGSVWASAADGIMNIFAPTHYASASGGTNALATDGTYTLMIRWVTNDYTRYATKKSFSEATEAWGNVANCTINNTSGFTNKNTDVGIASNGRVFVLKNTLNNGNNNHFIQVGHCGTVGAFSGTFTQIDTSIDDGDSTEKFPSIVGLNANRAALAYTHGTDACLRISTTSDWEYTDNSTSGCYLQTTATVGNEAFVCGNGSGGDAIMVYPDNVSPYRAMAVFVDETGFNPTEGAGRSGEMAFGANERADLISCQPVGGVWYAAYVADRATDPKIRIYRTTVANPASAGDWELWMTLVNSTDDRVEIPTDITLMKLGGGYYSAANAYLHLVLDYRPDKFNVQAVNRPIAIRINTAATGGVVPLFMLLSAANEEDYHAPAVGM